jgi:methylmalonyl-CoA mutase N-terminal domain/subunit
MSHRLEKNADTKNIDYKEPKTSRSYSTSESDADRERKKQTNAEGQTQDTEAIWDLTRESGTDNASIGNRGSLADEENASVDNIVEGIEKGSNKRRISNIEG